MKAKDIMFNNLKKMILSEIAFLEPSNYIEILYLPANYFILIIFPFSKASLYELKINITI